MRSTSDVGTLKGAVLLCLERLQWVYNSETVNSESDRL